VLECLAAVMALGAMWSPIAAAETEGSADVVPAWYATARTAPANPVQMARVLAMVHAAMHDAVNGAEPRYETYASDLRDRHAHPEAAAAASAHRVLAGLFPTHQATWDAALAASLVEIPDGPAKAAGLRLGAATGQIILDVRANDGWNAVDPFGPAPAPGVWKPTPPAFTPMAEPQFRNVRPFTVASGAQFRVPSPPRLPSDEYRRVFDEVKAVGRDSSATRTADQTHMAHFWYEPPYDTWSRIAGIVRVDRGYGLHRTARLYALVNMVACDGLIAGWYWKREHAFWRPITAIHEADIDGNPHTAADPAWNSLRVAPSHPDHPSTHSVLGGAAAEVVRRFVGSDHHPFCMTSLTAVPAGSTRCLQTFSQAQRENVNSRVYAGVHFRTAIEAGDRLGRRIGRFAFKHVLRPLECR
jgi:hypothetical protein